MPNRLVIGIYNSAGERVKALFSGNLQFVQAQWVLSAGVLMGGGSVSLGLGGAAWAGQGSTVWNGTNDNGQAVGAGIYTWKIESVQPDGTVVDTELSVAVLAGPGLALLQIFNSAGELVISHPLASSQSGVQGLALSSNTLMEATLADGSPAESLVVKDANGTGGNLWAWDGHNAQGQRVGSGVYTMVLTQTSAGQSTQVDVKSFTVIEGPDLAAPGGSIVPGQNPVGPGQDVSVRFSPAPGCQVLGELYTIAGERVARLEVPGASGMLVFSRQVLAAGLYFVRVEVSLNGQVRRQETVKIAVIH